MIFSWGFVILGFVVSVLALLGLLRGLLGRGRGTWRLEMLVLLLVVGAAFAGHRTFTGWAALLVAAVLQAAAVRFGRTAAGQKPAGEAPVDKPSAAPPVAPVPSSAVEQPAPAPTPAKPAETPSPESPVIAAAAESPKPASQAASPPAEVPPAKAEPSAAQEPKPAEPPPAPPPVEIPTRAYATCVLLASACEVAAEVFFASLRRGGLREAELMPIPDGGKTVRVRAAGIVLELVSEARKVGQAEIAYAASQSWDWPDAAAVAAKHAAFVAVTTKSPEKAERGEIVRLHRRAQAALAEFAPVLAVLWPGAGRLMPVASPAPPAEDDSPESAPTASCVSFRMFPPAEGEAGPFVSDSVGLHAFGLPDVQICGDREPDDAVSAVLYQVVDRIFTEGCEIKGDAVFDLGEFGVWRAARARSKFEPDREVIELAASKSK